MKSAQIIKNPSNYLIMVLLIIIQYFLSGILGGLTVVLDKENRTRE